MQAACQATNDRCQGEFHFAFTTRFTRPLQNRVFARNWLAPMCQKLALHHRHSGGLPRSQQILMRSSIPRPERQYFKRASQYFWRERHNFGRARCARIILESFPRIRGNISRIADVCSGCCPKERHRDVARRMWRHPEGAVSAKLELRYRFQSCECATFTLPAAERGKVVSRCRVS